MTNLFWIGFVGAALAGIYALLQARKVMTFSDISNAWRIDGHIAHTIFLIR